MANQNFVSLLLSSVLASFVVYKCFSKKKDIVEPYWSTSVPITTKNEVIRDGQSVHDQQKNLTYDTNPVFNPYFFSKNQIDESIQDYEDNTQGGKKTEKFSSPVNDEENKTPFYTVNGTYDPYLSPRMNPNGVASYVRYDVPDEKHLANKADDPFTVAEYFEKPGSGSKTKENFKTGLNDNKMYQKKLSKDIAGAELPSDSTMKNDGISKDMKDGFLVNGERLIFSTSKSFNSGLGCPIRGDLPVIGVVPQTDPNSLVMFRPSAGGTPQQSLRTGAINVIAGVGNTTAQQTAQLKSNAAGGLGTMDGGVPFFPSEGTIGQSSYKSNIASHANIVTSAQKGSGAPGTVTSELRNSVVPSNPLLPV